MKNRFLKTRILNVFLVILIIGTLLFEARLLTKAEEGDSPQPAAAVAEVDNKCVTHMKSFMTQKKIEFGQFMNDHFRSGKPTSELIDGAMAKYRQYRKDVKLEMANFFSVKGKTTAAAPLAESAKCTVAVDEDFQLMKDAIRQHIMENAYAKKSTRLLDKYKEINGRLDKMNFTVAQMYGYFATLSQKLPCYATKCLKK